MDFDGRKSNNYGKNTNDDDSDNEIAPLPPVSAIPEKNRYVST